MIKNNPNNCICISEWSIINKTKFETKTFDTDEQLKKFDSKLNIVRFW